MELTTVKAEVKAWEKAFRARQGKAPTKEDIKADNGGIGTLQRLMSLVMTRPC